MMRQYTFILLLLFSVNLYAQKEDYSWIVGIKAVKMDFTSNGFAYDTTFHQASGTYFFGTSFTENDSDGNLLFYSNGASIYDSHGNLMENGGGLNPSSYLTGLINSGIGNGFLQGAMAVRKPSSDSLYYLFHFGVNDNCPGYPVDAGYICNLLVTTINIRANNGLGRVIEKNLPIMHDSILNGTELTLIKHGNGKDWWLIKRGGYTQNRYYKFLVTSYTIEGPIAQDIGSFPTPNSGEYGTATISPDGTKFAGVTHGQKLNIFDFDRCTGLFSNPDTFPVIDTSISNTLSLGTSLAFSPNSRFLYVSFIEFIYQYDLHSSNIAASKVALINLSDTSNGDFQWLQMQLAPNGKIYLGPYNGSSFWSVINQPDSPGLACDLRPWSILMPCAGNDSITCSFSGMPMFPQYRLPTMPIYLADAGNDKETCKDTLVQLGSTAFVPQLIYTWSSNDPNAVISDVYSNHPKVSTRQDSAQFYLLVVDTVSKHSCLEKTDTITVRTNLCATGIVQTTSPIKIKYFPYLYVYDITPQTQLNVYDLLGQLVYSSANYQNDWDVKTVTNAVYVFQIKTPDGRSFKGRVVVVH